MYFFFFFRFPGAIFTQEDKDSTTEVAFKYAVYRINKDKAILPNTTLVYDIEYVSPQDSFKATKKGTAELIIRDKWKLTNVEKKKLNKYQIRLIPTT